MSGSKKNLVLFLFLGLGFLPIYPDVDSPKTESNDLISEKKETPKETNTKPKNNNDNEVADIYLNFQDATLSSVVNYLAEQRKLNIVPHKDLVNKKVSLSTREPLTLSRAWTILLTLLEINGFTIINVNDLYRIVPSNSHGKEPLPVYSSSKGVEPKDLPDSDLVVRYVYFLNNITIGVAQKIINDLLGKGSVTYNTDLKACIMTEKCFKIKAAMRIVKELDSGGLSESIQIIKLKHTEAEKIAELFTKQIINSGDQQSKRSIYFAEDKNKKDISYFASSTRIIPEPRQNALILLGTQQDLKLLIDFINKYIDVPMVDADTRIHIKEIRYVKASSLKTIISKVIVPPKGKGKSPLVGEFKYFEDVTIEDETPQKEETGKGQGNRLIIGCNNDDWRRLEQLIDKLDKPQPQIALEVMIVDVSDFNEKTLGAQIREKANHALAKGADISTSNIATIINTETVEEVTTKSLASNLALIPLNNKTQGGSWLTIGDTAAGAVWGVIKSLLSETNENIIAQPFLITRSGQECTFNVKTDKYIQSELKGDAAKSAVYKPVEAKTEVKLTPVINYDGIINLNIDITVDEFQAIAVGGNFPKNNRKMKTEAILAAGEILVIGGLTKDKVIDETYKTPILSSIPILGNLFKNKSRSTEKDNLYIFIRPSIIKPRFEGSPDEYTQLKLDYAKYQILNTEKARFERDPIQRWFFKPERKTVRQTLSDLKQNKHRPIDDFIQAKTIPRSVRIEDDPYYRTSEHIDRKRKGQRIGGKRPIVEKRVDPRYLVAKNTPQNPLVK